MPYALVLFIVMPILEIALLLRVGAAFGWLPTLFIVITTAILGSAMLRQQGLATLAKARQRMDSGEMPAQQLLEGLMIMIGGVLLLTPGFVTDAFGFLCLIPPSRQWIAARVSARVMTGVAGAATSGGAPGFESKASSPRSPGAGTSVTGDIIDGDFKRIDDD